MHESPSILVIDDDPETRAFLDLILAREGYAVRTAASGDEGLARLADSPADLAIIDVLMPGRGGLEIILEIRRLYPGTKLIAISGGFTKRTDDEPSLAETLGVDRTCSKPFTPEKFLQVVREVLPARPVLGPSLP
ncbi:MAG: response regulator [Limisphaerales bacterium]